MADTSNIAEPEKPRRRWFQFRLRTLLVGVVLIGIACYTAREYRIVAARNSWLAQHPQSDIGGSFLIVSRPIASRSLSAFRQLLGDAPQISIAVMNPEEEASAKQLFPQGNRTLILGKTCD